MMSSLFSITWVAPPRAVAEVARVGLIAHNLGHPSSIATIVVVVVVVACSVAGVGIHLNPILR